MLQAISGLRAQNNVEWKQQSTQDFKYYYRASNDRHLLAIDSLFTAQLNEVQLVLNHHLSLPIHVYLVTQSYDKTQLEVQFHKERSSDGGVIDLVRQRCIVNVNESPVKQRREFRKLVSNLILNDLMMGQSLQDQLRTANLVYLPEWVLAGLSTWVSEGWTAEQDNRMRVVFDEYGLNNFNTIPDEFNTVKGVAFWKFVSEKYGNEAIPALLNMIRYTRKLHAAVFYAFQVSLKELFDDWAAYYTKAYTHDQGKPNPVNGILLPIDKVYDMLVISEEHYLVLAETWKGYELMEFAEGSMSRRYRLAADEVPLGRFSGAIQNGNGLKLFVSSADGLRVVSLSPKNRSYTLPIEHINHIVSEGAQCYLSAPGREKSRIYKLENEKITDSFSITEYLESFDIQEDRKVYLTRSKEGQQLVVQHKGEVVASRRIRNGDIAQVMFANDSVVLFNSNANGIWNGKLWEVAKDTVRSVTNYRSNIAYHHYSSNVFVEYLDRGSFSSLYITGALSTEEFYTYNKVGDAYFKKYKSQGVEIKAKDEAISMDSLEDYTFQTPIDPRFDFVSVNYDSLVNLSRTTNRWNSREVLAPTYYEVSRSYIGVVNEPLFNDVVGFSEGISEYLPKTLMARIGIQMVNTKNTRSYEFVYGGLPHKGNHELLFRYQWKEDRPMEFVASHLQRKGYNDVLSYSIITDRMQMVKTWKINKAVRWSQSAILRYDRLTPLAINAESLQLPLSEKISVGWMSKVALNAKPKATSSTQWTYALGLRYVADGRFGVDNRLYGQHSKEVGQRVKWHNRLKAGTSFGTAPTYYILGGRKNDIAQDGAYPRSFSTAKEALYYDMEYGVRGFPANYRNGTSYITYTSEVELDFLPWIFKRPIVTEMFQKMRLVPFADMALSYYGKNIYDPKNNLNTQYVRSATGSIQAEVRAFKHPGIASYGIGLASALYKYRWRVDYARGLEMEEEHQGMFHFTLGYTPW